MRLLLLFGDAVVDQIKIDRNKYHLPGYIGDLQEALITRNEEMLECCADLPHFAIKTVPAKRTFENRLPVYGMQQL